MLNTLKSIKISKKIIENLPHVPGVYLYFNKDKKILYIGKSINLKDRVKSYFAKGLYGKTLEMVSQAEYISYIKVNSEIEALLLEAYLVHKYLPKYNISLRDDKNPLYVKITNDKYPQILKARKAELNNNTKQYFGPFPQSSNVKTILTAFRKVFPYSTHKPGKRLCLNSQIGLCNPCPTIIENEKDIKVKKELKRKYFYNIRMIKKLFLGNIVGVRKKILQDMEQLSNNERFYDAIEIRKKLFALDYVTQKHFSPKGYANNPNFLRDIRKNEISSLKKIISGFIKVKNLDRIECFDISHFQGSFASASMVTFIKGDEDKSLYRRFKIIQKNRRSDTDSLNEVVKRRIKHFTDWGKPDLIIVDGGKPQLSVFYKYLNPLKIPVMGMAKRFETLVFIKNEKFIEYPIKKGPALNILQRIRDESHRFAKRYHHKQVEKYIKSNF